MRHIILLLLFCSLINCVSIPKADSLSQDQCPAYKNELCEPMQKILHLSGLSKAKTLNEAVAKTQMAWLRKDNTERKDLVETYAKKRLLFLDQLKKVGLVEEITPQKNDYGYIFLLGSTYESLEERIFYLEKLIRRGLKFNELVLLGSHRPLTKEELYSIKKAAAKKHVKNEIEMMDFMIARSLVIKALPGLRIIKIASPMKVLNNREVRANTRDTIDDFAKLNLPKASALVISNQPHVLRQHYVVKTVLPQWDIETVGPAALSSTTIDEYLDELARLLYEINIIQI